MKIGNIIVALCKLRANQPITLYIKHLVDSANFKGITFNKHRNSMIGNRFEIPNVSYTYPFRVNFSIN
jgi:hypothetical protein